MSADASPRTPAAAPRILSQRTLVWMRFRRHKVALFSLCFLVALYAVVLFAEFFAPYDPVRPRRRARCSRRRPPSTSSTTTGRLHRPFVYGRKSELDRQTFQRRYVEDRSVRYPVRLLVRGDPTALLGLFETDLHLFGVDKPGASSSPARTASAAIS